MISGSASVMHVPTGLFLSGSYARYTDENRKALFKQDLAGVKDEDTYWYLVGGIEQNWFGIGKTTLYGEYGRHEAGTGLSGTGGQNCTFGIAAGGGSATVPLLVTLCLNSADVDLWGLGINQEISAAAMDFYLAYRHFSPEGNTFASGAASATATGTLGVKDFDAVMTGAIIRF